MDCSANLDLLWLEGLHAQDHVIFGIIVMALPGAEGRAVCTIPHACAAIACRVYFISLEKHSCVRI